MVTFLSVSFVMLTTVGIMVSSGTFFPYILEEFQESRASTAAIQSIFYGVGMGTGKHFWYYFEPVCHADFTASKVINISLGYILLFELRQTKNPTSLLTYICWSHYV